MIIDIDTRRERLATKVKWVLAILACAVVVPVVYLAIQGLIGIAIAGVLGLAIVNLAPVVSTKFANWKLKALKQEAASNPIETLQNQQIEKEKSLKIEADKISQFDAAVETYRSQLMSEAVEQPESAAAGIPTLRQMERLLAFRRLKYKCAADDIKARRKKVDQAQSRFRVALAAREVTKAAGETEGTVLDKILEDIAFNSVDETVNLSMAALRTAIMVEEVPMDDIDLKQIDKAVPLTLSAPTISTESLMKELAPRDAVALPAPGSSK